MSTTGDVNIDALCHSARDISKHIAGMADELLSIHHANGEGSSDLVPKQINKIRDQISLLSAVVEDIAGANTRLP
jgi:hypothetical protein